MERTCCYCGICLQWGHRLSAVETGDFSFLEQVQVQPSMGPPPFGSGNLVPNGPIPQPISPGRWATRSCMSAGNPGHPSIWEGESGAPLASVGERAWTLLFDIISLPVRTWLERLFVNPVAGAEAFDGMARRSFNRRLKWPVTSPAQRHGRAWKVRLESRLPPGRQEFLPRTPLIVRRPPFLANSRNWEVKWGDNVDNHIPEAHHSWTLTSTALITSALWPQPSPHCHPRTTPACGTALRPVGFGLR